MPEYFHIRRVLDLSDRSIRNYRAKLERGYPRAGYHRHIQHDKVHVLTFV